MQTTLNSVVFAINFGSDMPSIMITSYGLLESHGFDIELCNVIHIPSDKTGFIAAMNDARARSELLLSMGCRSSGFDYFPFLELAKAIGIENPSAEFFN